MTNNFKPIQSIQRAVNIIDCFTEERFELTLNEISELVNLNINTTRGLVNTLVAYNLINHNLNNTYSLGFYYFSKIELIQKNNISLAKEVSFKYLTDLAEKYQVSSRLNIVSSNNIFTLTIVNPKNNHYLLLSNQEAPLPFHATSSGKILLAYENKNMKNLELKKFTNSTITSINELEKHLIQIKEGGYSTEIDEIGFGISSIAVPIFNKDGLLFGTISITALTPLIKNIIEIVPDEMKKISKEIRKKIFNI